MTRLTKVLSVTALLLTNAAPAFAFEDGKLVIWTGTNRDRDQLIAATAGFTADLGIDVVVEVVDPDLPAK